MKSSPQGEDQAKEDRAESNSLFPKHTDTLQLEPGQGIKKSLGTFSINAPAKGYSIEITPEPESTSLVSTKIVATGSAKSYELTLFAVNYSDQIITVHVKQLGA